MKKVRAVIYMIITFFVIYFLQANFFTWFNISGIMPNLYVILVLFIGLFLRKKLGLTFGIMIGIFLDFVTRRSVGISCIMFGMIGFLAEIIGKDFSKDSRLTIILMVMASTLLYEVGIYLSKIIFAQTPLELFSFIKILIIEILFNATITIIIYPIMKKVGYYFEDSFTDKMELTRFF